MKFDAAQALIALAFLSVGVAFWIGWPAGLCALGLFLYADLLRGRARE